MRCTMRRRPDVYTVQLELELEGALDGAGWRPRRRRCWSGTRACGRRSGTSSSSRPVQVIVPRVAAPWRLLDLSELR